MSLTSVIHEVVRRLHALLVAVFWRLPLFAFVTIIRPLWSWSRQVAAAAVAEWRKDFHDGPVKAFSALLLATALLCTLIVIVVALSFRWLRPIASISISDFEVPMNAPVTGKTLAHLVSEELSQINDTNQRGDPFASKLTHYADTGALQTEALAIPAIGGVSVWGFSPDNLAAAWQFLRTDEQSISAELIGPVAGRFRLHASVSSSRAHGSWDQPITGIGDLAIQQACLELAHRILSELSPQAMGRYYLLTGQPILALAELHRWRLLQPRDPEPLFYIGWAYDRQADITADSTKPEDTAESVSFRKMATDSYHAALKIDPKHAESINALGLEAEIGGNNQLACNYYAAADTSKPNDPTFLANLGNCKMGQKRFSEAFRYYERALKRDPKFAGGWWNYGLALEEVPDGEAAACDGLAACLRADKVQNCKRRESQRAYETAVSLRGDFTEALIDLARVLRYDNQPAPAAATVSEAIRLLEKDVSYPNKHAKTRARAYETRCLAEEDERFLDQALTDCGLAAQLDTSKKSFSEHLARVAKEKEAVPDVSPH